MIEGPRNETVPFTFRLCPANYQLPAHWHPAIEMSLETFGPAPPGKPSRLYSRNHLRRVAR